MNKFIRLGSGFQTMTHKTIKPISLKPINKPKQLAWDPHERDLNKIKFKFSWTKKESYITHGIQIIS